MSDIAINVENLSKQYRLGVVGTGTISHDLNRMWAKLRGKDDPYLKIGEENKRDISGDSNYVWALNDLNFQVKKGEVLGIIGKNGAGKSTLLKILSRVTYPTKGKITIDGRVGSLLEVGTGFHPELTGRENIYLNGAILGMRKNEITSKLDEIVDFAGVERYVDTPVKRYSSGMKVRLGFSVAAHLEPEILIVDEVLAVGDIEFQKKCIGKMNSISKELGRTILFVSHNMSLINGLCSRSIILENGKNTFDGDVNSAIGYYLRPENNDVNNPLTFNKDSKAYISQVGLKNKENGFVNNFEYSEEVNLEVIYRINQQDAYRAGFSIIDNMGNIVLDSNIADTNPSFFKNITETGDYKACISLPKLLLSPGEYRVTLGLADSTGSIHKIENNLSFNISDNLTLRGSMGSFRKRAITSPTLSWEVERANKE